MSSAGLGKLHITNRWARQRTHPRRDGLLGRDGIAWHVRGYRYENTTIVVATAVIIRPDTR